MTIGTVARQQPAAVTVGGLVVEHRAAQLCARTAISHPADVAADSLRRACEIMWEIERQLSARRRDDLAGLLRVEYDCTGVAARSVIRRRRDATRRIDRLTR